MNLLKSFSCSTIGAIIMTPLLTKLLAGQLVPVDAAVRELWSSVFVINISHVLIVIVIFPFFRTWPSAPFRLSWCQLLLEVLDTFIQSYASRYWSFFLFFLVINYVILDNFIYTKSVTQVVFPVLAHEYFPKFTERIITLTPLIGVILTTLLCASPVSVETCTLLAKMIL